MLPNQMYQGNPVKSLQYSVTHPYIHIIVFTDNTPAKKAGMVESNEAANMTSIRVLARAEITSPVMAVHT